MCSEAVPLRSSDDRVCQIVMGLTRRSASKLWEIPKLVCTTHHVCTHTSRKRNMYQSITCTTSLLASDLLYHLQSLDWTEGRPCATAIMVISPIRNTPRS
jgi:hypothetical protein